MHRTESSVRRPSVLESLETRRLLATFTVTNVNDAGPGSLRQAITDAAASTAADVVAFNLTSGGVDGVYTIKPASNLHPVAVGDLVDGTTQPGYTTRPVIEIDGSKRGYGTGIYLDNGAAVKGLSLVNWVRAGVEVAESGSDDESAASIQSNYIGVRADGVTPGANGHGIIARRTARIGGPLASEGNVVANNVYAGILVSTSTGNYSDIDGSVVENNIVGLSADRTVPSGNGGAGIWIHREAGIDVVGGAIAVRNNVSACNQGAGIIAFEAKTAGVRITANSVYLNSGLGIDTGNSGLGGEGEAHQPRPVITAFTPQSSADLVSGYVRSAPNTSVILDFYRSAEGDPSGYGEGQTYVTSVTVVTDAIGQANFDLPVAHVSGQSFVSVTATTPTGQTSEFSNWLLPPPALGNISGVFFDDKNANGVRDPNEAGATIGPRAFVDLNNDGVLQPGEPISSASTSSIAISDLQPGVYSVRVLAPAPYIVTTPYGDDGIGITVGSGTTTPLNVGLTRNIATVNGTVYRDFKGDGVDSEDYGTTVTSRVWADLDNDAQIDTGEPVTDTSNNGQYQLQIAPGTYTLRVEPPAGWRTIGTAARSITLTQIGTVANGVDFAVDDSASDVRVRLFHDVNGNGALDANETTQLPLQMVFADLNQNGQYDPAVDVVGQTRGNPPYLNFSLPSGEVQFIAPWPAQQDDYLITTSLAKLNLTPYETRELLIGFRALGSIRVYAFDDQDADGNQDQGESLLAGRTVYLDLNNNSVLDGNDPSVVTTATDMVEFKRLLPGPYVVRQVLPANWTSTSPAPIVTITNSGGWEAVQLGSKSVTPPPPVTTTTLQAETATMSGGTAKGSSNGGYNGTGYADFGGQNSAVAWTITRSSAGSATLEFRYANGATVSRPLQVFVNNVLVGTINCEPTGAWTIWKNTSLQSVQLPAGNVVIKAVASTSVGGANVDQLAITSAGSTEEPPPPPPPSDVKFFEAESATMSGGTAKSSGNAGFTGTGFADYAGQGSAVQFNITRSASSTATLVFRYANGSTANRPLQILVNGAVVGTVACAPTGSWTKWANVSLAGITLPAGSVAIKAIASTSAGGANLDSLAIESGTVVPPPPPPPPPTDSNLTLEAESGQMKNGTGKGSSNGGFTGTGYADFGGQGSAVDFVFNRNAASTVSLQLRYANGSTGNRPLQVMINGNVVGTFACAPTGSWTSWQTATLTNISLPSGAVTVRLAASTSTGGGNVDWLKVTA